MQITDWLLDADPSLRWQVLWDLLDEPEDVFGAERAGVAREGHGAELLSLQDDRGYWNNDELRALRVLRWADVDGSRSESA